MICVGNTFLISAHVQGPACRRLPPTHPRQSHAYTISWMLRLTARRAVYTLIRAPITTSCHTLHSFSAAGTLPTSTPPDKYPTRGGQNLSDRFQRLEKSVRGKQTYQRDIYEISGERKANSLEAGVRVRPARSKANTFMGFIVPEEPKPPGPDGMYSLLS